MHSTERKNILRVMWGAYMEVECERDLAALYGLTEGDFIEKYIDHDVVPIIILGRCVGGAIFNAKGYMHLAVEKTAHTRWYYKLRPLLDYAFAKYGTPMIAQVNPDNKIAVRFVEQVGCVKTGENDKMAMYEIHQGRMRYGRSN